VRSSVEDVAMFFPQLTVSNASALPRHSIRVPLRGQIPSVLSYSSSDDSQNLSLLIIR